MNIDNLSNEEIRILEAEIQERQSKTAPIYQHYGPAENLSESEIRSLEARIKAQRNKVKPIYQHYGSYENLSENDMKIIAAQIAEKREKNIPYKEYFNNLIKNPYINDKQQFENAVIRSMESNDIMQEFTLNLTREISKISRELKQADKQNIQNMMSEKQKLENLVNVYIRYLYMLKGKGWNFSGPGLSIGIEQIDRETLDDLWYMQKNYDMTFDMPIPRNLGEDYGQAFERKGKMIPGITLMYEDLKGKEVNWHQILIYRENELTPKQRYMKRREEALKQFELARQEEQRKILEEINSKQQQNNFTITNTEEYEQANSTTVRR